MNNVISMDTKTFHLPAEEDEWAPACGEEGPVILADDCRSRTGWRPCPLCMHARTKK